jgi:hypothetical protein
MFACPIAGEESKRMIPNPYGISTGNLYPSVNPILQLQAVNLNL